MKVEEGKKYISQIVLKVGDTVKDGVLKVGDTVKDEVLELKDGLQELKQDIDHKIEAIGKGLDR